MKLALDSEEVGRRGSIVGAGAVKILGAPKIHPLEVVIREAVQNSWDAATDDRVEFSVRGYELTDRQASALRNGLAKGAEGRPPLLRVPEGKLEALIISDRGTTGLTGSVRADVPDSVDNNFARFVYMIGDTKTSSGGVAKGGTYGFGRSSFLVASALGTILVHTRCEHRKARESRFIGMTWTKQRSLGGKRLTGRHWWGAPDGRYVNPLTGAAADGFAKSIGMTPATGRECGTDILVLAPRWSGEHDDPDEARNEALELIRGALLWNCWPRLSDGSIRVGLDWFGRKEEVPDPASHPRVRHFVKALQVSSGGKDGGRVLKRDLQCLRPVADLGVIRGVKVPFSRRTGTLNEFGEDRESVRDPSVPLHHVALMRATKLVIKYFEGPLPPEGMQYAGAFSADPEVDEIYAASEPPTHDDWVKEQLERGDRVIVNVTYKRILDELKNWLGPGHDEEAGAAGSQDFGVLADKLGSLWVAVGGRGSRGAGPNPPNGGGGKSRRLKVTLLKPERVSGAGFTDLRVPVRIQGPPRVELEASLLARAAVAVDGGTEKEPPIGAEAPEIVGWEDGGVLHPGAALPVLVTGQRDLVLVVRQPHDCSVRLSVVTE